MPMLCNILSKNAVRRNEKAMSVQSALMRRLRELLHREPFNMSDNNFHLVQGDLSLGGEMIPSVTTDNFKTDLTLTHENEDVVVHA